MSVEVVLNVMLELFIIMAIGYTLAKLGCLDKTTSDKLSWMVVNLSMPLLIIASVFGKEGNLADVMDYLLYGCVFYLCSMLIAYLCCKLLFVRKKNMGTYQFILIFTNCSFMGYPVMEAVLGPDSVFYMSIFNLPFNILAFSYGIWLLSRGSENQGGFSPKKMLNAGIVSSILAIIIYANGIQFPKFIENTCSSVGGLTTPLSMLVLGITLAQLPVKELFNEIRLYPISAIRLVGLPVLTAVIVRMFTQDPMLIGVAVGTAAMPAASMSVMLTTLYGGNVKLASVGVFITTVCSVISIPLVLAWLL
ncbi:MAG: AEC family transporter [Wujia sp.]